MIEFDEFLAFLKRSYKKPDEIKLDLKKAFRILDINGDGFITREELQKVLTKMGETLTEKEVDEMMEKADKNRDGKIDYEGKKRDRKLYQNTPISISYMHFFIIIEARIYFCICCF